MDTVIAVIRVYHKKCPTYRHSRGKVQLDDFECVAVMDMVLPAVHSSVDMQRVVAMIYAASQNTDEGWVRGKAWQGYRSYIAKRAHRSTSVGDMIAVRLFSTATHEFGDKRYFEVRSIGFAEVEPFIGSEREAA